MSVKAVLDRQMIKQCYFITIDPVHIGTGEYRLGRVDNTIVREPGSNLPKIPGTSLCGAARNYAAVHHGIPDAAGRHQKLDRQNDKGRLIISAFGTATDTGGGQAGMVSICDARILFFPVYSLTGPVWVSTQSIIGNVKGFSFKGGAIQNGEAMVTWPHRPEESSLNLGWLMLPVNRDNVTIEYPEELQNSKAWSEAWRVIKDRIVIVSDDIFSQIVNSNLEVRTSVAIDPQTGAAEEGALFTYEAIPRATWLWTELVDRSCLHSEQAGDTNSGDPNSPLNVVLTGLKMVEYFGVGGMVTRGFGRMRLISEGVVNDGD